MIRFELSPNTNDKILYTVQYKESDFNFIKRLASRYGEWFYYDGQNIVFGTRGGKRIEMTEQQDIEEYSLIMTAAPQKFNFLSYDAKRAENYEANSESVSLERPLVNPFQMHAIQASENLFAKTPNSLYNHSLMESGEMEVRAAAKRQKLRNQNVLYLEAKGWNPEARLGDTVQLSGWAPGHEIFEDGKLPLESYRIIEIQHKHDGVNGYYNHFKAIPKDNLTPPDTDEDALPECEEQSAVVMDNNDPQGMSRIRVQFPWQKIHNEMTPWIRVATPYAGKGKGMHILPEIGEEVIVAFENGNAEKPLVLGTLFNGKGKSGHGGQGNYMKGLQTASGINLLLNDKDKSVLLKDPKNTTMFFDGAGNSSITTSTTQTITVGANKDNPNGTSSIKMDKDGNILIEANTRITLKVGNNTLSIYEENGLIRLDSKNILSKAEVGYGVDVGEGVLVNAKQNKFIAENDTVIESSDVQVNGDSTIRIGSPDTDII